MAENHRKRRRVVIRTAAAALLLAAALAGQALAQPVVARSPSWSELKPSEKQVLAPLEHDWDKFDGARRTKWRGIAERYPKMSPPEQQRVQEQIRRWVDLTPDERRAAREQYKSLKALPPEKKQDVRQKWEQYQQLPPETRRELATSAPPAPAGAAARNARSPAQHASPAGTPPAPASK